MTAALVNGSQYRDGASDDLYSGLYENRDGILFRLNAPCGVFPMFRVSGDRLLHYFTRRHVGDVSELTPVANR